MVWCIKLYGDGKVFTSTDTLSGLFCYICLSLIVWSRIVCSLEEIAYSLYGVLEGRIGMSHDAWGGSGNSI